MKEILLTEKEMVFIVLLYFHEITNNSNEVMKKENLLVNNGEVAKTFNEHFAETKEALILLNSPRIAQIY